MDCMLFILENRVNALGDGNGVAFFISICSFRTLKVINLLGHIYIIIKDALYELPQIQFNTIDEHVY